MPQLLYSSILESSVPAAVPYRSAYLLHSTLPSFDSDRSRRAHRYGRLYGRGPAVVLGGIPPNGLSFGTSIATEMKGASDRDYSGLSRPDIYGQGRTGAAEV